jgi:hypothetical protein
VWEFSDIDDFLWLRIPAEHSRVIASEDPNKQNDCRADILEEDKRRELLLDQGDSPVYTARKYGIHPPDA